MASCSTEEEKKLNEPLEEETTLNVDIEAHGSATDGNSKVCDETASKKGEDEAGDVEEAGDKKKDDEEEGEEVDPDALTTHQVIGSVAILIAFSLSFATSFFLTNAASRSLHADFTDRNYTCSIANMIADHNISCYGSSKESACIQVELRCLDFNDTKLLYEYYHSYYSKSGSNCSAIRCSNPDAPVETADKKLVKYPHNFLRSCCSVNDTSTTYTPTSYDADTDELGVHKDIKWRSYDGFYFDRNKPEAMFYNRSKLGTNNIYMSKPLAYCILIIPNVIMTVVIFSLIILFMYDKISAKEIYRPVTAISPLHMQVNGKWYIKDVAPEKPQLNAFEKLRASKAEG